MAIKYSFADFQKLNKKMQVKSKIIDEADEVGADTNLKTPKKKDKTFKGTTPVDVNPTLKKVGVTEGQETVQVQTSPVGPRPTGNRVVRTTTTKVTPPPSDTSNGVNKKLAAKSEETQPMTNKFIEGFLKLEEMNAANPYEAAKKIKQAEMEEGVGAYTLKKVSSSKTPADPDDDDDEQAGSKTTHYKIHHKGKEVGEIEHNDFYGEVKGKMHGKTLPDLSKYSKTAKNKGLGASTPQEHLHSFLKSKTGQKFHKEAVEELDELSRGKLKNYINNAKPEVKYAEADAEVDNHPSVQSRYKTLKGGIKTAKAKLNKTAKVNATEEVENVEEGYASLGTAYDWAGDVNRKAKFYGSKPKPTHGGYEPGTKDTYKKGSVKPHVKFVNTSKTTKEEVEEVEEATTYGRANWNKRLKDKETKETLSKGGSHYRNAARPGEKSKADLRKLAADAVKNFKKEEFSPEELAHISSVMETEE